MAWQNVTGSAEDVRERLGALDTDSGDVEMVLGLEALNDRGIAFYWDAPNAEGWLAHMRTLVTDEAERAIHALPYAQQVAKVVELWQAIGHVYRACNLSPFCDPSFRRILERDHHGQDSTSWCEDRAWAERVQSTAYRDDDGATGCITLHHRLAFRADGTVETAYLLANEASTDYWTHHYSYRADGSPDWRGWAWHHERGRLGWENALFPALHWYFLQARDLVAEIVRRGRTARTALVRMILEGHRNALVANLRTAVALRLYTPSDDDADGTSALIRRAEISREEAMHTAPSDLGDVFDGVGSASDGISQIPGGRGVGIFVGLLTAGLRAIWAAIEAAGAVAAQRVIDPYGREGFLLRTELSNGAVRLETVAYERAIISDNGLEGRPTHPLATPPAPRTVAVVGVFLPTPGAGSGGRPNVAELVTSDPRQDAAQVESHVGEHVVRADFYQDSLAWRHTVAASQPRDPPPVVTSGSGRVRVVVGVTVAAVLAVVVGVASRRSK